MYGLSNKCLANWKDILTIPQWKDSFLLLLLLDHSGKT